MDRRAEVIGVIIETNADLAAAALELAVIEPRFAPVLAQLGGLPLRRRADGFAALLDAIVSQQVSVASANAILARLKAARCTGARQILAASDQALRDCGLSRQKMRYLKALAGSGIRYRALRALPNAEVIATLTEVPGIGNWTAEIYVMFALGRADVFAPGDLALQEAARLLFGLPERPGEKVFREMAAAWAPWRSVAARVLWAYYRQAKSREGIR